MIFIYDRDEKQIAHLDTTPKITEEIGKLRVLEFESELEFEKGFRIVADIEDKKAEFIIIDIDYERDDTKNFSYFCQDSFIEMQSVPILDKRPTGNIESAMTPIFDNTRWIFEIRSTDTINQNYNNSFYHINALEAFAETVEKYRVEWITEFKYVGSKITERRVVIYRRDGRSKGRLEFGKNIKKFSRKILSEPIVTALYPYGKGEDLGNGSYGRRIGIESVNNGIPYIENKQATELYGIGEKGSKKPLFAFITFEEETDPVNLKIEAQKELDILSQIRAEHIVEAIDLDIDAKIGYEVAAIDDEIGYRGYSRIIKLVRQGDDVEVTFGQVTKAFTDTFQKTLKKTEQGLIEVFEQVNIIRTSANGKTDVFTGPTKPADANEGDIWYRYNADGTVDLLNFVNGEWVDELSEKVFKELRADIEANTQLVNDAKLAADKASQKVDDEVAKVNQNIVNLTKDLNDSITEVDTSAKNNYNELTSKVTDLTTALEDKPDKTYVNQTIDEKTGTITQTIGQIETKVNELDAVPVYTIGTDGYWYKDGVKTSTLAVGKDGKSGANFTWNMIKGTRKTTVAVVATGSDATFTNNQDGSVTYQTNTTAIPYSTFRINGLHPVPTDLTEEDMGKDFVFSIEAKSDILVKASIYLAIVSSGYVPLQELDKAVGKWHRVWFTAKISKVRTLQPHFQINTLNANVSFRKPMLHFGTIPAPYAPHITEIQGADGKDGKDAMFIGATPPTDTTIAWLDTNTNSVKRYYNGAWYDINAEIKTKLNTVVDTVDEHTQTIGQVNADLKKKVETSTFSKFKQEYDQIVSTVQKTETDLSGFKTSTTTKLNEQKQTLDANISKISNLEKDLTSGTTYQKIQTIEQTANGNKTTIAAVKKTADGAVQLTNFNTTINTVKESISTIGKKADANQTVFNEFKRTAEQTLSIISDPTKKGLLSAINQQAGQILMQVGNGTTKSRLNLTKDGTYIDNALIESAHIKDGAITTAKIGDAQIDTAKIADAAITSAKILNLDVNKVSGLTSEFVRSKWNAINSSVTLDGNGMYIDGDWGGAINFTRRGQTFYDKIKGQVMGYQYGLYRNYDDPRVGELMRGVFLGAEMGYELILGIRKEMDNQNSAYSIIRSAGGVSTWAEIFGVTQFKNKISMNGNLIEGAANAGYSTTYTENGYCMEFANGFKVQWKRLVFKVRSTGDELWTFPVPFKNSPIIFGSPTRDDNLAANTNVGFKIVKTNQTYVQVSNKTEPFSIMVMAIGI